MIKFNKRKRFEQNKETEVETVIEDLELSTEEYQPIIRLIDKKNGGKIFEKRITGCIVIGRKPELCDIALVYDNTVSSRQCRIYTEDNICYIMDLEGTNVTYLNDKPVIDDMEIKSGDTLGFGRVDLKVTILEG